MKIIKVEENNIEDEHICCAIGNDKANTKRALSKKEWMKKCFEEGLVFKKVDVRGKVFVEYTNIENAWKPVFGKNYLLINCLWVSGQYKGKGFGKLLLEECLNDAKLLKKDGVAVISSKKKEGFLTDKKFFEKYGFKSVENAPPFYELLVYQINKNSELPRFSKNAKNGTIENKKGFTFVYSNQCPFTEEYVDVMIDVVKERKIPFKKMKIDNCKDAQNYSSPFGTFGVYFNGKILTHEIMAEKKFNKTLDKIL